MKKMIIITEVEGKASTIYSEAYLRIFYFYMYFNKMQKDMNRNLIYAYLQLLCMRNCL